MNEKSISRALIPPIPFAILAIFLSLAWLIPNHTLPWTTFYSDAIAGVVLLFVAIWVLLCSKYRFELIGLGAFFLLLALVPWLQYSIGVIYSLGTAWINSLYLLGLSLAIFAGWHWEKSSPGQCLDFLFLAIGIAAVVSVGIQLLQWFQLGAGNPWIVSSATSRYYANIGQPNQLASLLLMAVVGVAWGYAKKALGSMASMALVSYFLFGVALTESRTAWLNVAGILAGFYFFWGITRPKYFNLVLIGFGAYFVALYFCLPAINSFLFDHGTISREVSDPFRLEIWKSLMSAAIEGPWLGYGWGQTSAAVLLSSDFPSVEGMTRNAHNIIVELLVYNGPLLGGLVALVFGRALIRFWPCRNHEHFIIPGVAIGVLLVHAMLELPLHYGYFLLPFGMILGVLVHRSEIKGVVAMPKWVGVGFAFAMVVGLWITIVDSLEAERTYYNVYFGKKRESMPPEALPKVIVLMQWDDRLKFANVWPETGLPQERLAWMKGVVMTTPHPAFFYALAQHFALSEQSDESRWWLDKVCKTSSKELIKALAKDWEAVTEDNPAYRKIGWDRCRIGHWSPESD